MSMVAQAQAGSANEGSVLVQHLNAPHEYETTPLDRLNLRYATLRLPHPQSMAALRSSIARHGILHPVVVNRERDELVLLDGFKRLEVLRERREDSLPCRVVTLSVEQSKAALLTLNKPNRGLCELEESWVVASLIQEHGLKQTDVATLLGKHKSWVCRRFQLTQLLESSIVEDMRLGLLSSTIARELVRLPRGNQPQVATAVSRHGLTSRQTSALVTRLLESDTPANYAAMLEDPLRFLDSEMKRPPTRRDPRLSRPGEKMRRVLLRLQHPAMTANSVLRTENLKELRTSDLEILAPLAQAIIPLLQDDIVALGLVVVTQEVSR